MERSRYHRSGALLHLEPWSKTVCREPLVRLNVCWWGISVIRFHSLRRTPEIRSMFFFTPAIQFVQPSNTFPPLPVGYFAMNLNKGTLAEFRGLLLGMPPRLREIPPRSEKRRKARATVHFLLFRGIELRDIFIGL